MDLGMLIQELMTTIQTFLQGVDPWAVLLVLWAWMGGG